MNKISHVSLLIVISTLVLVTGCVGGVVTNGAVGASLEGVTINVKNCPTCGVVSTVTDLNGVWKFDPYDGGPYVMQGAGADAVEIVATKAGYSSRKIYDTVVYSTRNGRYYKITDEIKMYVTGTIDSDGDGLFNNEEAALGTDPNSSDTDGDGISDAAEVLGYNWVDYSSLGTDPLRMDLLIDVDYERYTDGTGTHSAKLSDAVVDKIREVYVDLDILNPDGSTGVNVIVKQDDTLPQNFNCDGNYTNDTVNEFDLIYRDTFHHACLCLGAHAGRGQINGNHFHVVEDEVNNTTADDQTEESQHWWYSTFVHELGHNISLRHGGFEDLNRKPNYPSLMNYAYDVSFNGSASSLQDTEIQFSDGSMPDLDESSLSERNSFTGMAAADVAFLASYDDPWRNMEFDVSGIMVNWDRDSWSPWGFAIPFYDVANIQVDINQDGSDTGYLEDNDDLAQIETGLASSIPGATVGAPSEKAMTYIEESVLDKLHD